MTELAKEALPYLTVRFGRLAVGLAGLLMALYFFQNAHLSLSVGLGASAALINLWLSNRWLQKLITPRGAVGTIVGVLVLKILGLLLLAYLMIVVRAAEPFSLGLAFVSVTILSVFLLGLPRSGSSS